MSGSLALGGGAPRAFGIEGKQGMCAGAPQNWRKQRLHSWRTHIGFHVNWVPGQSRDSLRICQTFLQVLEGILGKQEGGYGLLLGQDIGGRGPGNIHQRELP